MVLPVLLAFAVIGWEQFAHGGATGGRLLPYEILHWASDSLLALPLAYAAVWTSERLAIQQRLGRRSLAHLVGRAALIALAFAFLLVPGAAIHELADSLTHAHAAIAVHSHVSAEALDPRDPGAVAAFALHGLSDGLAGQVVGMPVAFLSLVFAHLRRQAALRFSSSSTF